MHYYNTHTTHISACIRSNIVSERGKREGGGREGRRKREREGEREGGRERGEGEREGGEGGRETRTHPWCAQGLPGAVSNPS